MAEQNLVELDTDEVKEEAISVAPQEQETKAVLEEVDLGYTDPVKQDTEAKIVEKKEEEFETDDLSGTSENVQKRISQLTRKYREAERREKAALDYAKGLQQKYQNTEKQYLTADDKYIKEFDARVDSQREEVKRGLKKAIEDSDSEKIMEFNDRLTQLAVEKEKARIKIAENEEKTKTIEEAAKQPAPQPESPAEASPRAKQWADDNNWFGEDKVMTNAAFGAHQELVEQGFDAESEDYYNEINKRMREYFPHKFADDRRPVQTVASAGRKQQGRRTVKLTRSQVAIAKKLGVPLEEYAKFVKE